jgi:hypothetical protein
MTKCKTCGQELPKKPPKEKKPKVDKYKGSEEDWLKDAAMLAFSYCPTIFHCRHCDYPVVDGYGCSHCGSDDPGSEEDDGESTHYLFSWPYKK